MYREIDRTNVDRPTEDVREIRHAAHVYMVNRQLLSNIRAAYMLGQIDYPQMSTLRGQVKAGDADGAQRGMAKLLGRRYE